MSDEAVNKPATAKRPALGRGLGALLGETRREAVDWSGHAVRCRHRAPSRTASPPVR